MAVRRGTATPSAVYRGTVPVQKVMRGTVEVWSNSYEASGTIPQNVWTSAGERTIGSHVMPRGATVQVVAHVIWARVDYNSTTSYRFSIELNGVRVATGNPTSTTSNYRHEYEVTVTCAAGDVVSFSANTTKYLDPWNTLTGGGWSIVSV